jgi:hypothetical protein
MKIVWLILAVISGVIALIGLIGVIFGIIGGSSSSSLVSNAIMLLVFGAIYSWAQKKFHKKKKTELKAQNGTEIYKQIANSKSESELFYNFHRLTSVACAGVADLRLKQLGISDKDTIAKSYFQMFILAGVLIKKSLYDNRLPDSSAIAILMVEDAMTSLAGGREPDSKDKEQIRAHILVNFKKYGQLPFSGKKDAPAGTFIWEYGKYLTEVFTGKPPDTQLKNLMNICGDITFLAQKLETDKFTSRLTSLRSKSM